MPVTIGWRAIIPVGFPLILAACIGTSELPGIPHPEPERIVHEVDGPAFLLNVRDAASPPLASLVAHENGGSNALREPEVEIGVLEGPEPGVLGKVTGAAIDAHERLLLLDAHARQLRIFDPEGRPLQTLGGRGDGPGEFWDPRALSADSDGHVAVFDGSARVHLYRAGSDSVAFLRSLQVGVEPFGGCLMEGKLYLHGRRPESGDVVHIYTLNGEPGGSFGTIYRTDNAIVRTQISRSRVACVEEAGLLLLGLEILPEIRAYSATGRELWWAGLEGYLPADLREVPRGSVLGFPEGGYHLTSAVVPSPSGDGIFLQVALLTRESRERGDPFARLETIYVSIAERKATHLGHEVPPLLAWGRDGRLLAAPVGPYPRVRVLELAVDGLTQGGAGP